ncbi:uncharacterized protein LOC143630748 [Bidens hawaiensis]|uniref:uncharacterized protein LOC143630748 n=1 Tax=Bidens hawaiensis TaxID=980011 RepID=UPI004048EC5C
MANQVVQSVLANQVLTSQAELSIPNAHGRAFVINSNQAQHNNYVVNGVFLVNNVYASIFFDTGANVNCISFDFQPMLLSSHSKPEKSFTVEVANGKTITIDYVFRGCIVNLNDYDFSINLILMQLRSSDIIVGMDWLAQDHAITVCFEKYIRIPLDDDRFFVFSVKSHLKGLS